jgi:RNA polymerase sigma-70 factor (ECF subfamily)
MPGTSGGTVQADNTGWCHRDRDVLLMIAWADLSYTEVATALGIPVGTVRSRLHRARARIRAALGGDDPTSVREESLP